MSRDIHFIADESNPYAPPSATSNPSPIKPNDGSELRQFLVWEKLRLLYNAILGIETALLLAVIPSKITFLHDLFPLVGLCFAANVCFCLGPVLDGYARWIGLRHWVVTALIFCSGTSLAALVTVGAVLTVINPNMRMPD